MNTDRPFEGSLGTSHTGEAVGEGRIVFAKGLDPVLREQFATALGGEVVDQVEGQGQATVLVLLDTRAPGSEFADLGASNAFAACRQIKHSRDWKVYLIVDQGDLISPEVARFCLADGCFEVSGNEVVGSLDAVSQKLHPRRPRVSTEDLLARLEASMASDEGRQASALQRLLAAEGDGGMMAKLVDPETGLFDGPFASFKLDEEFKRAMRFHQPLSLLLLDIGVAEDAVLDPDLRQTYVAEVASVFLNECRDIDILGRFTESTFMVLMPGTGAAGAETLARRMLEGVQKRGADGEIPAQPVAGLATIPASGVTHRQAFMARAEACLELARQGEAEEGFCAYSE